MLILLGLIDILFAGVFFLFHRYLEMGVVVVGFVLFVFYTLPSRATKKQTIITGKSTPIETFQKSLYTSSTVLFYTALVGISIGISKTFGVPMNMKLFCYSTFFLTSVIYGIYLITYPRNPVVFALVRIHTVIAASFVSLIILTALLFGIFTLDIMLLANLVLLFLGCIVTTILDRHIPLTMHITSVYVFLISYVTLWIGFSSYLSPDLALYFFIGLVVTIPLYFAFPRALKRVARSEHAPFLTWHFSNCILGISWALFLYFFWAFFWGTDSQLVVIFSLSLILLFWIFVYITDRRNPIFFTGAVAVLATFYGYMMFRLLPPSFILVSAALFFFSGLLLLGGRLFRSALEERILAVISVLYLCVSDIIFIFQDHGLFALSIVFFFQSFLWYGAYEVFQSHAKNKSL